MPTLDLAVWCVTCWTRWGFFWSSPADGALLLMFISLAGKGGKGWTTRPSCINCQYSTFSPMSSSRRQGASPAAQVDPSGSRFPQCVAASIPPTGLIPHPRDQVGLAGINSWQGRVTAFSVAALVALTRCLNSANPAGKGFSASLFLRVRFGTARSTKETSAVPRNPHAPTHDPVRERATR